MTKRKSKNWLDKLPSFVLRWGINLWPPYLGSGIKVVSWGKDFRDIKVILKSRWYNKNYVGTHFGGSMFSMTDPFFMLILLKNLGPNYIVWDKAASIKFKKPAKGLLSSTFNFTDAELDAVRKEADDNEKHVFDKAVDIVDEEGQVVASVIKTLYVKRKS